MIPWQHKKLQVLKALQAWHALGGRTALTVGEMMTVSPSCLTDDLPLVDVVRMFHRRGFRHFLVEDRLGKLCGIVSDRDVLRWLGPAEQADQGRLETTPLSAVMSTDLLTTSPQTPVIEAMGVMVQHGVSSLPVLEGDRPVGILTSTDLHVLLMSVLEAWFQTAGPSPADSAVSALAE